jgi:hypothetical protein
VYSAGSRCARRLSAPIRARWLRSDGERGMAEPFPAGTSPADEGARHSQLPTP